MEEVNSLVFESTTKTRRPTEVKTQPRKKVIDAQLDIVGFCACGRPDGTYKMDKKFCSRYCSIFMTTIADGFKKKTL